MPQINKFHRLRLTIANKLAYCSPGSKLPSCSTNLPPFNYYEPQLISYQAVRDQAEQAFNVILQGAAAQATLDDLTQTANDLQEEFMSEIG